MIKSNCTRGYGSMVEHLLAKEMTGVRFSLAAQTTTLWLYEGICCDLCGERDLNPHDLFKVTSS